MSMERIIQPERHSFISQIISFSAFKEAAIKQRDSFRSTLSLAPLKEISDDDSVSSNTNHSSPHLLPGASCIMDTDSADVERMLEVFGESKKHAQEIINSLSLKDLNKLNQRDILFRPYVPFPDVPGNTQLDTLKLRRKALQIFEPFKRKPPPSSDKFLKLVDRNVRRHVTTEFFRYVSNLKYAGYIENELKRPRLRASYDKSTNDILVTLEIYRPLLKALTADGRIRSSLRPCWKYVLRGETSLLEMQSLFKCSADFGLSSEANDMLSESGKQPDLHDFNFIKYPSSFIFIHDTFYFSNSYSCHGKNFEVLDPTRMKPVIDISDKDRVASPYPEIQSYYDLYDPTYPYMRLPKKAIKIEKAKPIREWMAMNGDFGPAQVAKISDFKVKDLICRLGFPYVYVHQGFCEHMFTFTNLELMNHGDVSRVYPLKILDNSIENRCKVCSQRVAGWIVEDETLPEIPMYMCEGCHVIYTSTKKFKRRPDTKEYRYLDPSSLQL